jgi:hypothetical protein
VQNFQEKLVNQSSEAKCLMEFSQVQEFQNADQPWWLELNLVIGFTAQSFEGCYVVQKKY